MANETEQLLWGVWAGFNADSADQAWYDDKATWPKGEYEFLLTAFKQNDQVTIAALLKALKAPPEGAMFEGRLYEHMRFTLAGEKKPQNFFRGFIERVAPWALWPSMLVTAGDGRRSLNFDFMTGGQGGVGARLKATMVHVDRPGKDPQTGEVVMRTWSEVVRGSVVLLAPSSYATMTLGQLGIDPMSVYQEPTDLAQKIA